MTTPETVVGDASPLPAGGRLVSRAIDVHCLLGLIIVAALPAVFWTVLIKVACRMLGVPFGRLAAMATAIAIGTFLAATYVLLIRRR